MHYTTYLRPRPFALVLFLILSLVQTKAFAASNYVCLRNTGDVPIEVAVLYEGDWGGWFAEGWWRIEPEDGIDIWSGCTLAPEASTRSNLFRLAVRQEGIDGRWGSAAFDVKQYRFDEDGSDTIGATYWLVPRMTLESDQTMSFLGERDIAGVKLIKCVPAGGVKALETLQDEVECPEGEIHTLFSTLIFTPTDGGLLQDNIYEVSFASSTSASVFFSPFDDTSGEVAPENRPSDSANLESSPKIDPIDPEPAIPAPSVGVSLSSEKVSSLYWGAIAGNCQIDLAQSSVAPCTRVREVLGSKDFEILSCSYGPFSSDGTGFETYQFWKDRAPTNMEQFEVPGDVHPFSYLGIGALQERPADTVQLQAALLALAPAAP